MSFNTSIHYNCLLLSIAVIFVYSHDTNPKVNVKNGTLEGTILHSSKGRPIYAFKGIPYAQPPLGLLRFHDPLPANSWEGVRSAKNDSNACLQKWVCIDGMDGDEDCLYLNVFTPTLENKNIQHPLPVMVWIHGGGYQVGNANPYNPIFLLDHDVVLVTMNYRLGILGFLSAEDLALPGNYGHKDQVLAIRWVQENIANFNGDPNKVTLFGQSAGGTSIHYHMMSPLTKGLFHRAISESGNSYGMWAVTVPGHARNNSIKLANALNCPSDPKELVTCLRGKDAADITKAIDANFREIGCHPYLAFPPVIEPSYPGAFISEDPRKLMNSGQFQDVPWLTGVVSQEGALFSPHMLLLANHSDDEVLDENFNRYAPIAFVYRESFPKENHDKISRILREFYFGDKHINDLTRENVTNLMTDSWFLKNHDEALRDHLNQKKSSPIYNYYFSYRGTQTYAFLGDPKIDYGVCHGDEQIYLFDTRKSLFSKAGPMNKEELGMVDLMTTLWTNFARTGNPTPEINSIIPTKWEPVRTSELEYLHIRKPTDIKMEANLLPERVNLWRNITSLYSK